MTSPILQNLLPPSFLSTFNANLFSKTVNLIYNTFASTNTEVLQQSYQQLNELTNQDHAFNYYLVLIIYFDEKFSEKFDFDKNVTEMILGNSNTRMSSFILLKNNVLRNFQKMPLNLQNSIKILSIDCLGQKCRSLRLMSGVLVTSILSQFRNGFHNWPEFLNMVIETLEKERNNSGSTPEVLIVGIFWALEKICEDCSECLELDLSEESIQKYNRLNNGQNTDSDWERHDSSDNNNKSVSSSKYSNSTKQNCQPYENPQDSPLFKLLPLFIDYFTYQNSDVQAKAVSCCNHFIVSRTGILTSIMLNQFINGIFGLITKTTSNVNAVNEEVEKNICKALVLLLEVQNEALEEHMPGIVDYMLHQSQNNIEKIALEACEFWLTLAEQVDLSREVLLAPKSGIDRIVDKNTGLDVNNRFSVLIPILTRGMKYQEDDPILLRADQEEDDAMLPDRDQDVQSRGYHANKRVKSLSTSSDPDDDLSKIDDGDGSWNIRKCSAAALDLLSSAFPHEMCAYVMPELHKLLNSGDWKELESGILILGAIAEGCISTTEPDLVLEGNPSQSSVFASNLPTLVDQMIKFGLGHEKALIRSISCWTLSRYSPWIIRYTMSNYYNQNSSSSDEQSNLTIPQVREKFLTPLTMGLLERILDNSKRVQEAACSAFATLEEEATSELYEYLPKIIPVFIQALKQYQTKNLLILYDAIGTLADCIGDTLGDEDHIIELLNQLIIKWDTMPTDPKDPRSTDIFQLLECLSALSTAVGLRHMSFSETVFHKSLFMIRDCLAYCQKYNQEQEEIEKLKKRSSDPSNFTIENCPELANVNLLDAPNKDYIVVGLDLLSGVTEGLNSMIGILLEQAPSKNLDIIQIMLECTKDPQAEVRQSAFAFLGDLTKSCYDFVHPNLHEIIPIICQHIVGFKCSLVSVCNNATWALGEICVNLHKRNQEKNPNTSGVSLNGSGDHNQQNKTITENNNNNNQCIPPILIEKVNIVMQYLCQIITIPNMQKTLIENTAITIGRLGLLCPKQCSEFIAAFIVNWCNSLKEIRDNDEKYTAFLGLVNMLNYNSKILNDQNIFVHLCVAITSWNQPPDDLYGSFRFILHGVVESMGQEGWRNLRDIYIPVISRNRLFHYYQL